ncbi:hypothetical protein ABXT08_05540 [Chryseobacterium sp. NRRL B-14859]|uniref:hypothetical protein n=1 Tax=unclassified Chryseobacterium TaxID=2593645 RepID=UPI003340336B
MKTRLLIFILSLFQIVIFAQNKSIDTIYLRYDNSIDHHYDKKGKINYFDICINNNFYKRFQYGTSNGIKRVVNFDKKETTRNNLYRIIQNDSPSKSLVFIIIKKQNNSYYLYTTDYMVRTLRGK